MSGVSRCTKANTGVDEEAKKVGKKGAIFISVGFILRSGRLFLLLEGCEKRFKGSDVFKKGTSGVTAVMNAAPTQGHCFYMFSSHFK